MSEWLPIETAPKDRTYFLGFSNSYGVKITHWDSDEYARNPRPFWSTYGSKTTDRINQPTHWMPLPEPPK